MSRASRCCRLFAAVLSALWPMGAAGLEFSAEELPPVVTRVGELAMLQPLAINNRGQVLGGADVWDGSWTSDYWVAFRFDPDSGSISVDPGDGLHSEAFALDERGGVVGSTCGWHCRRDRIFRYTDDQGFDFLREGSTGWIRRSFFPTSVTARGDMAGYAYRNSGREAAVLYLGKTGWVDLASLDRRLIPGPDGFFLNAEGDFVLATWTGAYGVFGGGPVIEIGPDGLQTTIEALGAGGEVVGEVHTPAPWKGVPGPRRAFVYTPGGGFREIHPSRLKESIARWVTASGVVGGIASRMQGGDTFFTYGPRRGLKLVNLRRELRRLYPGWKLLWADLDDMNEHLQVVGTLRARLPKAQVAAGEKRNRDVRFLLDPEAGMVDLQRVVDQAGLELELFARPVDLNDRGQVLLRAGRADGSWSGVVITPRPAP